MRDSTSTCPNASTHADRCLRRVASTAARASAALTSAAASAPAGSLQRAVHRCDRGPEQLGHLLRPPAQYLAQDQHGALAGRQLLQHREREQHRLPRRGHIRRVGRRQYGAAAGRPRRSRGCFVVSQRTEVHRPSTALGPTHHVGAHIRRDPIQPRPQRRPTFEAIEVPPCPDQRLLDCVLGLERRPEHMPAVAGELTPVLLQPGLQRRWFPGRTAIGVLACRFEGGHRGDHLHEARSHRRRDPTTSPTWLIQGPAVAEMPRVPGGSVAGLSCTLTIDQRPSRRMATRVPRKRPLQSRPW